MSESIAAQAVIDAYIECALWSSTDEDGEPLDSVYGPADIEDDSVAAMAADVHDFLGLIEREGLDVSALSAVTLGHDFWLTRNRHGAGFWDRGLGELGDKLTALAHPYGESYLYVTDDGTIAVA